MIRESLRRIPFFADLPDSDLDWLSTRAEPMEIASGADLIREGEPGDAAYIVLDGEFEVVKRSSRRDIVISVREGRVLRISGETFKMLLAHSSSASMAVLQTVSRRLRQNEALLRQNEKMAALGTLAAGLAHELNNPAAAVRRSADQMKSALA